MAVCSDCNGEMFFVQRPGALGALDASASWERTLDASFSASDLCTDERRLARLPHLGHTFVEF